MTSITFEDTAFFLQVRHSNYAYSESAVKTNFFSVPNIYKTHLILTVLGSYFYTVKKRTFNGDLPIDSDLTAQIRTLPRASCTSYRLAF